MFIQLADLGDKLTQLHLLKEKVLSNPIAKYEGIGTNIIEKAVYKEESQRVHINSTNYFEPVTREVWNYQIGGYQVIKKYFDYRTGKEINDIQTVSKIISSIYKTIDTQEEIDNLFLKVVNNMIDIIK